MIYMKGENNCYFIVADSSIILEAQRDLNSIFNVSLYFFYIDLDVIFLVVMCKKFVHRNMLTLYFFVAVNFVLN